MNITSKMKVLGLAIVAVGSLLSSGAAHAQLGGGFGGGQYTYCATENSRCNVSGFVDIAYGADSRWAYRNSVDARRGFDCNNATFGDPASGTQKTCWTRPSAMRPPGPPGGGPGGGPGGPGGPGSREVIRVQSATYGANVRAGYNNAWNDIAQSCNGLMECSYQVSTRRLGDPAPGQQKDYMVEYTCGRGGFQRREYLRPEANGQFVTLRCR